MSADQPLTGEAWVLVREPARTNAHPAFGKIADVPTCAPDAPWRYGLPVTASITRLDYEAIRSYLAEVSR